MWIERNKFICFFSSILIIVILLRINQYQGFVENLSKF
jgi:hypothetical protein